MVFTTPINLIRVRGPDRFWKRRRFLHMAAHFYGRPRNCYKLGMSLVIRALAYAGKSRVLKKEDMRDLWNLRINAGCDEHNISSHELRQGLERMGILLNNKALAELAIWEPKTFESVVSVARQKMIAEDLVFTYNEIPTGNNLEDQPILRSQLLNPEKK